MVETSTIPNPDLSPDRERRPPWAKPDRRRSAQHDFHRVARYTLSFRAANVMTLAKRADLRIAEMESVRRLTSLPSFTAMVVIRGQHVLFERYARDLVKS
jgi:hypothetical protein